MSLLLAVETATSTTSVALLRGEDCVASVRAAPGTEPAEALLGHIDALLRDAGVAIGDLDALAVSVGPGSFTGIRVGVATAQGLAFGRDLPAVGVSTLAAVAAASRQAQGATAALLDARRGDVYAAAYDASGNECVPEAVYEPAGLAALLPLPCALVGEGAAVHGAAVQAARPGVEIVADPAEACLAVAVARIARATLASGSRPPAAALTPRYLRRAEAEVARTGLRFEAPGGSGEGR